MNEVREKNEKKKKEKKSNMWKKKQRDGKISCTSFS